jgi:two-component sensor histidine kinase
MVVVAVVVVPAAGNPARSDPTQRGRGVITRPLLCLGFALVLHELAANAAKYGSLKSDSGFVQVLRQQENGRLDFSGRKVEGLPFNLSRHIWFGRTLAKNTIVSQPGGTPSTIGGRRVGGQPIRSSRKPA